MNLENGDRLKHRMASTWAQIHLDFPSASALKYPHGCIQGLLETVLLQKNRSDLKTYLNKKGAELRSTPSGIEGVAATSDGQSRRSSRPHSAGTAWRDPRATWGQRMPLGFHCLILGN